MAQVVNINIVDDKAVDRKIQQTATKLKTKYNKKRKINEDKLLHKSLGAKVGSIVVNSILVFLIIFSAFICCSTIYNRLNKTLPSFAGFSFMQVVSGSMTNQTIVINGTVYDSGHAIGDNVVIRSVDTSTLNVGDRIAFYVEPSSFTEYYSTNPTEINETKDLKYSVSFSKFFGFQPKAIEKASKANRKLVFHHIIAIYEKDGTRWFKTQGSSVSERDYWVIKDDYVVGVYNNSGMGKVMGTILTFLSSKGGLITTIITPLMLVTILIVLEVVKNLALAKLELDCVEEKRKITDEICVKNNVGYNMSKKTKYKILAQAKPQDKLTYISLLWKDGSAPNSIKKYALRKEITLRPMRKLLELNRECEKKFKAGRKPENIAKYYLAEKAKIEAEQQQVKNRLKMISKNYKSKKSEVQ